MRRDFERLEHERFDLLVVGGGIYGAWAAYDAVLRGLRVALVEQDDWSAGTSSASSKLIHGGLRYLEQGRLGLVRKSLRERERLWRLAPHHVLPLRFIIPVYAGSRVGRLRLQLGLWVYDFLAGAGQPVAGHRSLSREQLLRSHGFLKSEGLRGGFSYGDCGMDDARFTLEIVAGAWEHGAAAVNRARAVRLLQRKRRVVGAEVEDLEGGRRVDVRAAVTLACAGPWLDSLLTGEATVARPLVRLTRGTHLVMPPLPTREALLLLSEVDRRVVFLTPWHGMTLLGTTDTDYGDAARDVRPEQEDVAYLLERANRVLAGRPWSERDVRGRFAGLRCLPASRRGAPSSVSRELRIVQPLPGLLAPIGGKYTSARVDAARLVDRASRLLGRGAPPCATEARRLPWCPSDPVAPWRRRTLAEGIDLGLDRTTLEAWQRGYGRTIDRLFRRLRESPARIARLVPGLPFREVEVVHAVEEEMARDLLDVLRRRTPLWILCPCGPRLLQRVADLAGEALGWSDERKRAEVAALLPEAVRHEPV